MDTKELNLFLQPREEVAILPIENKTLISEGKGELSYMASLILEGVDDGKADPLDTLIIAKKGAFVFDAVIEGLKNKVVLPEGKDYSKHGCAIREQMTGVRYSFDKCNDPVWSDLAAQLMILQEKIKARETWLKGFSKPTDIEVEIDEETGEITAPARTIYPPAKTGGQSVIITIK